MVLSNKERQPGKYVIACARCGADTISTGRKNTLPLCLICRAFILALTLQERRPNDHSLEKKSGESAG
jgi:hypothetical protein